MPCTTIVTHGRQWQASPATREGGRGHAMSNHSYGCLLQSWPAMACHGRPQNPKTQNKTKQKAATRRLRSNNLLWTELPLFVSFCFVGSRAERSDLTQSGGSGGRQPPGETQTGDYKGGGEGGTDPFSI